MRRRKDGKCHKCGKPSTSKNGFCLGHEEKSWIIVGATNPDPISDTFDVVYWGRDGWSTDLGMALVFDSEEAKMSALPRGGQWLEIGSILK